MISKRPQETNPIKAEIFDRATPTPITMSSTVATAQLPPLQVQLLSDKAKAPTRGSAFAAGYDLYSSEDTTVPARGKAMVKTNISIAVPEGTCAFFLATN
jgi:dUTP pyrophosphatase